MIIDNHKRALCILAERLNNSGLLWVVAGSTNQALQGIELTPKDLDIIISLKNLPKVKELLKEFSISEIKQIPSISSKDNQVWEAKFNIKNTEVQAIAEKENGTYVKRLRKENMTLIKINNTQIPCFKLEIEAECYKETNRPKKAERIRNFLNSRKKVNCASFIFVKDGKFLVEKRAMSKLIDPGALEIPGGHFENGETAEQALLREVKEELSVVPTKYKLLCRLTYKHPKETQLCHYFIITEWVGEIKNQEAESLQWLDFNETNKIDVAPDRKAVEKYIKERKK